MKFRIGLLLALSCIVLQRRAHGAPPDEHHGKWVEMRQTNTSLSITATNLTILDGTNREVWVFVPSTNRFSLFVARDGVTNAVFAGYGGTCDRVIFLGKRRWFVNRE